MPNRLIHETSPYLLQHAENPVDWYPWGPEALERAQSEDRPIFLSIGYAACHWCHVMEHESFEDAETAEYLNRHFVPIKVDREERPDLDSIYMNAVVALTSSGGWPMSVFLTPDGKPFYAGTYFPDRPRYGMPSFKEVLAAVVDAWQNRREDLLDGAAQVTAALQKGGLPDDRAGAGSLHRQILDQAVARINRSFDWTNGGWGGAPKFPQPMTLEFLLRRYVATRDESVLKMVTSTLDAMAHGGIYDQLGGGFHRYATDAIWLVPHFEKMLYDNAQLARVYLHAWQVTGDPFYRRVVEQTIDYVSREMVDPAGGFYSTQDADSEGEEGKFFLWTPDEIREVLGADAALFMDVYGVTEQGNFEGKNILHVNRSVDDLAAERKIPPEEMASRLDSARERLFALRERRVKPARDEKVLTAWNGLMLAGVAEAARVLHRDDYRALAERNADFVLRELRDASGRLLRSWKAGDARLNSYLEDYANLAEGLLALYETTFDERWFATARELADRILTHFADPAGGWFDTSDDHESLVVRPQDWQDNATPSGNGMAATVLLRLAALTGEGRYADAAENALRRVERLLATAPIGFAQWLVALDFARGDAKEIAIVGEGEAANNLLDVVRREYRPNAVVALARPGEPSAIPLLHDRVAVEGRATAYVCRHFVCQMPAIEPDVLATQLGN